jgi:hypothetical protein
MADGDEIPDRVIACALEFAVGIAAAGAKVRPPLAYPAELKPFLKFTKLPSKALRDVRRAVEGDPAFLRLLGKAAVPELLDEAGMLWLTRPEGWVGQLEALEVSQSEAVQLDTKTQLRRAERRRDAAEQATHRVAAELASTRNELERVAKLHADAELEVGHLRRERDALRGEASVHQAELRRAVDRLGTAQSRLEAQRAEATAASKRADEAEQMRDAVLAQRAAGSIEPAADDGASAVLAGASLVAADLAKQAQLARTMALDLGRLAGRLESLELSTPPAATAAPRDGKRRRAISRKPVALPGGLYGSSNDAAEFLVRVAGIVVLVDGYNVAKLGWPTLDLDEQRDRCIATSEDIARRFGANITVVFDGTTVTGASASSRRLVRVAFSPEGVIADDVIRAEAEKIAADTPILVVTNDQAVLNDVRSMGANTLTSGQWLDLARR